MCAGGEDRGTLLIAPLCGAKQGHRHEIMQKVDQTKQTSFSPSALSIQLPLILLFVPYANRHNGEKPTAACPSCTASSECIDLEWEPRLSIVPLLNKPFHFSVLVRVWFERTWKGTEARLRCSYATQQCAGTRANWSKILFNYSGYSTHNHLNRLVMCISK